jgi:hypothetical protein
LVVERFFLVVEDFAVSARVVVVVWVFYVAFAVAWHLFVLGYFLAFDVLYPGLPHPDLNLVRYFG